MRKSEAFKNMLILLLCLSLFVLSAMTFSGNGISSVFSLQQLERRWDALVRPYHFVFSEESLSAAAAARPDRISVKNGYGRQSIQRDFSALDDAYEALGSLFGEALEHAGAPEAISELQFLQALRQESVYFHYAASLPLSLIAAWLSSDTMLTDCAESVCLSPQEGTVRLYFRDGTAFYSCSTSLEAFHLQQATEAYRPDGSAFACELDDFAPVAGESLLQLGQETIVPAFSASNPLSTALQEQIAVALGFNPYAGSSYTTSDGSTVYEEAHRTLLLAPDGMLTLQNNDSDYLAADSSSVDALCEAARRLLETLCSGTRADARLYLTQVIQEGTVCRISFDYFVSGTQIRGSQTHAVTLQYSDNRLRSLQLLLRAYAQQGSVSLLGERQAAAIIPAGDLLQICYQDTLSSALSVGWCIQ